MAILRIGQTIHDFVQSPITPTRDDQLPAFGRCALRHFSGVARAARFDQFGLNAGRRENPASFVEHATASVAAIAGVRVVDQQCVS
jgi:hypothetical protein